MQKNRIYERYIKRLLDVLCSLMAFIVLLPILIILTIIGALKMKGNPFFTQERPGKSEKIFKLIKFRSMTCEVDKNGELLPDAERLTGYGRFLRCTSLDELPELINIIKGDMSFVGPRPLLVKYLPYYSARERMRHNVRPGLTGLAQINGRNYLKWDDRLALDVAYVENISLKKDLEILINTVGKVLKRSGVAEKRITPLDEERMQYENL